MDKERYEKHKPFAGEKKPSMQRRCVGHDYQGRQMYLITMVTEERRPLLGHVTGRSDAPAGSDEAPRVVPTELGERVSREWWLCSQHHPEIEVVALQLMPDHLHGILFVRERMEAPLGMALRGFKQSCNKHYRALMGGEAAARGDECAARGDECAALTTQQTATATATQQTATQQKATQQTATATQAEPGAEPGAKTRKGEDRSRGLLFARGYNDRLLMRAGQLDIWRRYLEDNPRRLLMKREHPDLFRVQRNVKAGGQTFSAIGNLFLLERPVRLQVQCSRRLTEAEIGAQKETLLRAARAGAVLVSPAISPGEKAIMHAAFDEGLPLVFLQENGFTDLAKPGGRRMDACARGQLLILAPWEHHNERLVIRRDQCLSLNEMARRLCTT